MLWLRRAIALSIKIIYESPSIHFEMVSARAEIDPVMPFKNNIRTMALPACRADKLRATARGSHHAALREM